MKAKIRSVLKRKDIWIKIGITIGLLILFRFGAILTIPGVTINDSDSFNDQSFFSLLNMLGGGAMQQVSLFALGVSPYITASIIIQLLASDVIPPLARMKQEGQKGQTKMEKITRLTAILIAIIQGLAITLALESSGYITLPSANRWLVVSMMTVIMVAGSMVTLWIADQITIKGVGNGTSLIIFVGIVSTLPFQFIDAFEWIVGSGQETNELLLGLLGFGAYILVFVAIIFVVAFFTESERKIPLQQTGKGLNLGDSDVSFIPFKVNPAGVIPVIFATAIITLPPTIASLFPVSEAQIKVIEIFDLSHPFGLFTYAALIYAFTFFYSHISLDPEKIASNFKKSNTFILGVKPGEDTEKYLKKTINNLCFFGATYLALVSVIPYLFGFIIPASLTIGGTQVIIMVSVALETWKELKGRFRSQKISNKIRSDFEIKSLAEEQEEKKSIIW